ncbi:hypothetical protein EBA29_01049 [Bacillus velezensis]|nr:hypothetical protein EBA29_01049 [Bacillus velezensis]CDG28971.1 conserved protein of unknown function [Bacillus velezensis UCMB5033]
MCGLRLIIHFPPMLMLPSFYEKREGKDWTGYGSKEYILRRIKLIGGMTCGKYETYDGTD